MHLYASSMSGDVHRSAFGCALRTDMITYCALTCRLVDRVVRTGRGDDHDDLLCLFSGVLRTLIVIHVTVSTLFSVQLSCSL